LEGEEDYFIDQLTEAAEKSILKPEEAAFNCTVFYGRDTSWADVLNQCRRYPMFAERQVVILKEAQQLRDIEKFLKSLAKRILQAGSSNDLLRKNIK